MASAYIGYGILIPVDKLTPLNEAIVEELGLDGLSEIAGYAVDEEEPMEDIEDTETLYVQHVQKKFPLLDLFGYGEDYFEYDAYALFVKGSLQGVDGSGDFTMADVPSEAKDQLAAFIKEFGYPDDAGWKKWVNS